MANSIPTISALRPVLAWQGQPLSSSSSPANVGELLRLTVTAGPQGELLARNEQGLLVNVPSGAAAIGDVLVLRVLAIEPRLELQLLERRSGAVAAGTAAQVQALPEDTAALRTDQAWLQQRFHGVRQAAVQELPAVVAAQWRGRVLAALLRGGVEQAPALPGAPAQEGTAARPGGEAIPLQGWQGQALQLRLLNPQAAVWPSPEQEEEAPPRQPAEPEAESAPDESGEGLRLGLILSLHGDWVQVVLQWQHGLLLHFSADQPETLQILRGLMPRIAAALAAVPLRLRHCQLSSKPPAVPPLPQAQQSHGLAHSSSGALFRAAAEIAKVLQQA